MTYRLAVIGGDGIGPEVTAVGVDLLERMAALGGPAFMVTRFDWGSQYFLEHGRPMPADGLDRLRSYDAILLGALGDPRVPDRETVRGLVIRIRQAFGQYVNVRPVKSWRPGQRRVDLVVVRENSEGEYAGVGGRVHAGGAAEAAMEVTYVSRAAVTRVARFAFDLARRRRGRVTSVTKSNALVHVMTLWDEVVADVAKEYPDVECAVLLADNAGMQLVLKPEQFDVVLASNLLGDILSDVAAGVAGGLGHAPSANLNPDRTAPSMFEPVHGSAPDIAGRHVANPIAMVLSIVLLLEHLGETAWASRLEAAVARIAREGPWTPDWGGDASTEAVGRALAVALEQSE
jgi:tartrate dehydrogenase/decarboxylase/D-malate dehydrogenase